MAINKNPFNLPTEKIGLPSKGLIYPVDHVLSQGFVELVYPSAKQEDILTNANYLEKGIAVDKYLESILLTEASLEDMIPGDKDTVMVASRILGFGSKYTTNVRLDKDPEPVTFDLTTMKEREIDFEIFTKGVNEFLYTLPGGVEVKFKFLNGHDVKRMMDEEAGFRKVNPNYSADTTLYLSHALVEVNGSRKTKDIRDFVDQRLLQLHARELKKYITSISPGYTWRANAVRANKNNEAVEDLAVPYTINFFWPA